MESSQKNKIKALLTIVTISFICSYFFREMEFFSKSKIQTLFDHNIVWSSLLYILIFTVGNLLYFPGIFFLAASIYLLGPIWGYLLTLSAANISAIIGFLFINKYSGGLLETTQNKRINKILSKFNEKQLVAVILLRLCFQTNPALNYTLAITKISFKNYLIGSLLGLPIPIAILTALIQFGLAKI